MSARAIVLAAGKGTRMKSAQPKVLHELCGRPMLWWVLDALRAAGVDEIVIVCNAELESQLAWTGARTVVQTEQLGTGHAVRIALDAIDVRDGTLLVAYGDMPLVDAHIFEDVRAVGGPGSETALALVTARMPLPSAFGRIVRRTPGSGHDSRVARIVEAKDCTLEQLALDEMNAGIYAFDETALRRVIVRVGSDNAQREYYLTDTVELLNAEGLGVAAVPADARAVLGVNDRVELAAARAVLGARLCEQHQRAGVTIVDPATTYLEPGLLIGADTIIYPGTTIGGATTIGRDCRIGPHSRLANARVAEGVMITESVVRDSTVGPRAYVGPFAHVRDGTVLGADVRIGNFVEVKNGALAEAVKAGHLAYLGDTAIGARTNIGAGTITCNFDGEQKNHTAIGADAFIGSNSSLVAPLTIGDGAVTGAGAVVIRDVPAGDKQVGNPARSIAKKTAAP